MSARRITTSAVVIAAFLFAGCASAAPVPLAPAQEARLMEARAVLERVRVAYQQPTAPELRVRARQPGDGAARYVGGRIYFDPSMLGSEIDYRPALAHESAHWLRGDVGDAKCRGLRARGQHSLECKCLSVGGGWGGTRRRRSCAPRLPKTCRTSRRGRWWRREGMTSQGNWCDSGGR